MKYRACWNWIFHILYLTETADQFLMEMKEYQGYLPCTPYESWIEHMKQLSCQDMEQQCDYIRLSMGLLNHGYIGEKSAMGR